jgi:regulator of protease activity HflC (stomatin/prohibitin superfamily)
MSTEKQLTARSGWPFLVVGILALAAAVWMFVTGIMAVDAADTMGEPASPMAIARLVGSIPVAFAGIIVLAGLFTLQPGQARVCVLFGRYDGTVRAEGLLWANPFYSRELGKVAQASTVEEATVETIKSVLNTLSERQNRSSKVSVRARTLNGDRIKVNDRMGNPIEIATVVVWHVADTAKALFDVDDYESFVDMTAETALRHVASLYAYDHMEDDDADNRTITLRSNVEEVSQALREELGRRLSPAGVAVDDARLTHLAYAPEIAQTMLRRQQAEAIIAARKKIVEGAVSMVDMALSELSDGGIVDFDEDRKATMASNLMVVLCGESEAQPVLNTGSLY